MATRQRKQKQKPAGETPRVRRQTTPRSPGPQDAKPQASDVDMGQGATPPVEPATNPGDRHEQGNPRPLHPQPTPDVTGEDK